MTFKLYSGDSLDGDKLMKSESIRMELEEIHKENIKLSLDESEPNEIDYDPQSMNSNIRIEFQEVDKDTIKQHLDNSESKDDKFSDMLLTNATEFTIQDHENTIKPYVFNSEPNEIVGDDPIINNHDIIIKLEEIDRKHINRPSINSESKHEENSKTLLSNTASIIKDVEGFDKSNILTMIYPTQKPKVECSLCKKIVIGKFLPVHILKKHCKRQIIKCTLCEYKSDSNNALKNHFKVHKNETSSCDLCKKNFKDLDSHVKYFHEMKRKYHCTYCEKKFQNNHLLENHVLSVHHGTKVKCPNCDKRISIDNFTRHIKERHEMIKKACPFCKKEYGMSNLSKHIRSVHKNETQKCPECDKTYSYSNLKSHINQQHKRIKKTCDVCHVTVSANVISIHMRRVHNIGKPLNTVTPRGPNRKSGLSSPPLGPNKNIILIRNKKI